MIAGVLSLILMFVVISQLGSPAAPGTLPSRISNLTMEEFLGSWVLLSGVLVAAGAIMLESSGDPITEAERGVANG